MVVPKGHAYMPNWLGEDKLRMKFLKDWFPAMVRRLSITLTDMTSNLCLCASGSPGRSEDLPLAQVGEGVDQNHWTLERLGTSPTPHSCCMQCLTTFSVAPPEYRKRRRTPV
jgi:hypothetical protein